MLGVGVGGEGEGGAGGGTGGAAAFDSPIQCAAYGHAVPLAGIDPVWPASSIQWCVCEQKNTKQPEQRGFGKTTFVRNFK